jgi:hypothetical protein
VALLTFRVYGIRGQQGFYRDQDIRVLRAWAGLGFRVPSRCSSAIAIG